MGANRFRYLGVCAFTTLWLVVSAISAHGADNATNRLLLGKTKTPRPLVGGLPGVAEPIRQVTLSAPLSEVLTEILVDESERVKRGQAVAKLDTRALEVNLRLAKTVAKRQAAIDRAHRQLELTRLQRDRMQALAKKGAATQAQLDQVAASYASVEATVNELEERQLEARLQVEVVESAIEKRTLRAPFSGQVLRIYGEEGETLEPTKPVLSIANLERLEVSLNLPIELFERLKLGKHYDVWAATPVQGVLVAKLVSKEPLVRAATGTFRCSFEIPNPKNRHPAGFAVRLIELDKKSTSQPAAPAPKTPRDPP